MMKAVFLSQKSRTNKYPRSELISHSTPVLGSISFLLSSLLLASQHGFIRGSSRTLKGLNSAQANNWLTKNEFNQAIEKMIPHKSPGLNGVSPNTIKALDNENRNMLFQICSNFPDSGVEIEN